MMVSQKESSHCQVSVLDIAVNPSSIIVIVIIIIIIIMVSQKETSHC